MSDPGTGRITALPVLGYKPGWTFKIGGPNNSMMCVMVNTTDSQDHSRTRSTQHMFTLPTGLDARSFARWVRDRLFDIEHHETCEFLTVDGFAPFHPYHQDEGDPYELIERWQ